jgi:transcriptional regulator with XRE-family HTH domain
MNDNEIATRVGQALGAARVKAGLSKREAARTAGMSEGWWRHLESGRIPQRDGSFVAPNPRDETLIAAARAVGLRPRYVLDLAGRDDVEYVEAPTGLEEGGTEPSVADLLGVLVDEIRGLRSEVRAALDRSPA